MLNLPKKTERSKQLAKKAIYAKFQMNTAEKNKVDADISKITIVNEISQNTVNISAGEKVTSIFVLLVSLKNKNFDEKTIKKLSELIPQNILFVLEYGNESKLALVYKNLIQSDWKPSDKQQIDLVGLDLDKVWENIVISVGGITVEQGNTIDTQLEIDENRKKIRQEIAKLEKKAWAEKQPKKKFELAQQIKKLKQQSGIV